MEDNTLYHIPHDDSLQKVIDNKDEDDFDSIINTIFSYYEQFLDDDKAYESYANEYQPSLISSAPSSDSALTDSTSLLKCHDTEDSPLTKDPTLPSMKHSHDVAASRKASPLSTASLSDESKNFKRKKNHNNIEEELLATYKNKKPSSSIFAGKGITAEQKIRLEYLIQVPKLMSEAVNAANATKLRQVIEESFLIDTKLRTDALQDDVTGRENIISIHEGVFRVVPDFVMNILPSTINHRVITTKVFSSGTVCRKDDPSDYLFNHFKHRKDNFFEEEREAHALLIEQGKPVGFKSKSLVHLILNKEMTHVEKYFSTAKSIDIAEVKFAVSSAQI